uniref:Uncharacterized protein n=1 Tax=Arundo donax TaxID=35708 RepID=A0A0A8ZBM9_ARUDO
MNIILCIELGIFLRYEHNPGHRIRDSFLTNYSHHSLLY